MTPAAPSAAPFEVFFDLVPTGAVLYAPIFDANDDVVDFRFVRLNPAGQRLLGLPAQPTRTFREQYPHSVAAGIFAQYRTAYLTGQASTYDVPYAGDGLDTFFRLVAQRSGELLVVNFTDMADLPRSAVENALREARAAEQTARAEAEAQRQRFYELLMQLPAQVAVHEGPDQVFTLVNSGYQRLAPGRDLLGQPIRAAWPELGSQGILDVLDQVYRTGEPFIGTELPFEVDFARTGRPEQVYFNAFFQPLRSPQGQVTGVLDFSYDVTEQVLARRHLEQLNQELEARVQARTREAEAARATAEQQRARLERLWQQAPAAICMLSGPELVFELVNPGYQQFFPGRPLLGKPLREALPELADHAAYYSMKQVYDTGEALWQQALHVPLARTAGGALEDRYFNYVQQPRYDEQGRIDGVLVFGFEVTELVQAQQRAETLKEQVRQSTERLQQERDTFYQIFEMTPAAICIQRGPEHRYEYANAAYLQFFPGRQMLGQTVAEALPETVESGVVALLDHVYQTGETYYGEELPLLIAQPEGPPKWMYFTFTYQAFRENGEIVGISTFAYNVAEQVQARQAQEAQRRELEQLFMQAPAPIVILDGPELVFQLVNPAYQRIFPGRVLAGKPILEALPELTGTPIPDLFRSVYQTGKPVTVQELPLMMARHEGQTLEKIYWSFTYQARRNAQGEVDGVRVFAHDVTEQVRTRQASEAAARNLRLITDALPVLISYLDRDLTYRFANRAYEPWFGLMPEQMVGRPIREVAGEQAFPNIRPYLERTLAGERVEFEAEMPFRPHLHKHIRTTYIPDVHEGTVQGMYTLVSDITDQVEARRAVEASAERALALAEELATANEQLVRTNVDLDNFIYTASHDLKAPITNIEGLLDTLRYELPERELTDEVSYILGLMQDSVHRFKRTIEHLATVSKLQKEHTRLTEQVALAPIIEDVRLDLAPLFTQTGGSLQVDVQQCPSVLFSEKNLRSVVYNFLSNALKYHHPDRAPRVQVRCRPKEEFVVLEVEDNGLGIDLTRKEQLFAMFQRLHTHVEGTGIGLYMVKRMVENAGGHIEVHSQVGEGPTFAVYFPRSRPASPALLLYGS